MKAWVYFLGSLCGTYGRQNGTGTVILNYFYFLQLDIKLPMSPVDIYSSNINASLYSERIPKKPHLNPWFTVIKFAIQHVHIKHYLLHNSPEECSSPNFPALAHHVQKYTCNFIEDTFYWWYWWDIEVIKHTNKMADLSGHIYEEVYHSFKF